MMGYRRGNNGNNGNNPLKSRLCTTYTFVNIVETFDEKWEQKGEKDMDLSKGSRFYTAYGDMWALFKKYCNATTQDEIDAYHREGRELEEKYPEFRCFVSSTLYHYKTLIYRQVEERLNEYESAKKAEKAKRSAVQR